MVSPKVSVIVPNYNHATYLRQRLDSIFYQTFQDFEVIILDDCSTDSSREIINEYRHHSNLQRVIFNDVNSGSPFLQWKSGISFARGEWLWIAESDDYADEKFLEILLKAIPENKKVGIAYCDSKILHHEKVMPDTFALIKNNRFDTIRWSENYYNEGQQEIEKYLLPGGTINNTSAVLFNRRLLIEADPFDISLRYIGDKYAFVKVLALADIVYVKEGLNYFRDPFNDKHLDRYIFYFYEQFLVANWVYRTIKIRDRQTFFAGFYNNTRNSLFREWNGTKVKLYSKLFRLNPGLMTRCIFHNLLSAFGIKNNSRKRI